MKRAAIIAVVLVLLLGGVLVYGLIGTRLGITPVSAQVIPATEQPGEFARLQRAVARNALVGTAFQREIGGSAEEYTIVIYTVALKNTGLLPAEMAELVVSPAANDVLCYTDQSAQGRIPQVTVPPGETVQIRCVLLTKTTERMSTVRDLYISYYVWGHPFTIKMTHG